MKYKILSLIIISLMVISVIGSVNALQLTANYPVYEHKSHYRYIGDDVGIVVFYTDDNKIKDKWLHLTVPNMLVGQLANVLGAYTTVVGHKISYRDPESYDESAKWQKNTTNYIDFPQDAIGKSVYVFLRDASGTMGNYYIIMRLNNYDGSDFEINYYDRGYARYPHIDVKYQGKIYDGKDGNDLFIN
ncbi:MAG: hypothetical protein LBT66_04565 [Methanobrevibacter sp.]|jgi:hypothetical protein|nr:hypothetical protein [Candidatus Methanovirga meridionalis]